MYINLTSDIAGASADMSQGYYGKHANCIQSTATHCIMGNMQTRIYTYLQIYTHTYIHIYIYQVAGGSADRSQRYYGNPTNRHIYKLVNKYIHTYINMYIKLQVEVQI